MQFSDAKQGQNVIGRTASTTRPLAPIVRFLGAFLRTGLIVLIAVMLVSPGCHTPVRKSDEVVSTQSRPRVLFIGSSSIYFWKSMSQDFADVRGTIMRNGVGGRTLADVAAHVNDEIIARHPDKVLVYGGSIDMHDKGATPEQTFEVFKQMCAAIHAKLPATKVYFISCKPSIAKWEGIELEQSLNALVKQLAASEHGIGYIDTYTPMLDANGQPIEKLFNAKDHNHLNKEGYALWTSIILPYLSDE